MLYRINAHDCLNGHTVRNQSTAKVDAVWQANTLFSSGKYLWVDVVAEDNRGRITIPHHVEREPTDAERSAICARYSGEAA